MEKKPGQSDTDTGEPAESTSAPKDASHGERTPTAGPAPAGGTAAGKAATTDGIGTSSPTGTPTGTGTSRPDERPSGSGISASAATGESDGGPAPAGASGRGSDRRVAGRADSAADTTTGSKAKSARAGSPADSRAGSTGEPEARPKVQATPGPGSGPKAQATPEPAARPASGPATEPSSQSTPKPATEVHGSGPLVEPGRSERLHDQWSGIQSGFVDDPRDAVRKAGELADEVMKILNETVTARKRSLDEDWRAGDGEPDTERLRLALHGYRDFVNRVLSV